MAVGAKPVAVGSVYVSLYENRSGIFRLFDGEDGYYTDLTVRCNKGKEKNEPEILDINGSRNKV